MQLGFVSFFSFALPLSLVLSHSDISHGREGLTRRGRQATEGDSLLHASSAVQLWRIAERRLDTDRWLAGKVVIAVPGLSNETVTADDDVGLEGVAGTVDRIGDVARPFSGCWVAEKDVSIG